MTEAIDIAKKLTGNIVKLPSEELAALASILVRKELHKGEIIVKEGMFASDFYFIESGLIRQFYFKGKHDVTEHFACENQFAVCILSLFRQEPTKLIVEALENGVMYLIPYSKLLELTEKYTLLATFLRKMLEESLCISQEKADSWRFETARERYNRFLTEFPQAAKRASINHIASYLLMTPESLSRVRAGAL
ncbi:MAG: Crp/Fnr family transcriptional regulator [Bacteroidales bacterium]